MSGLEKTTNLGVRVEKFKKDFFKYYLQHCPTLFHICYDPIGTHKRSRAFIGFLLGFFMSVLLYECIIVDLNFDRYTSLSLALITISMMSIGCAASIQVRCVCLLTIPAFFGRSGRSMLRALILGYIIAGPLFNLMYNAKEVMRTFACTSQLTYNLTKTRFDLMFKPFQQAIHAMKADTNEIKDTLSSVRDLMSPIVEEVEGEEEMRRLKEENDYLDELQGDTKRSKEIEEKHEKQIDNAKSDADVYEAKYKKKIEARCEEQLSRGAARCRDMFSDAYNKCYQKVTFFIAWLLCWPMKLTFVCNLVQALGGSSICDPEGKVDSGIGEGYAALKNWLFYEALDLIRRHAYMEYTQTGHHDLLLEIRGTGVIASLIRSAIRGFNVKKHIKTVVTNEACLPKPMKLPTYVILKIYGTFFGIFVLIFASIYTQRTRRGICSFFYRKREKRRVLYLYNESLRRRITFAKFMKAKVRTMVRTRRLEYDVDFWMALRLRWPDRFGWLEFFACARERCLICEEVEPRKGPKHRRCTTPGCPFVHCSECWRDVGKICYACTEISDTDSEEYDTQRSDF